MAYKVCSSCGKHVRDSEPRCWNCQSVTFLTDGTPAAVPELSRPTPAVVLAAHDPPPPPGAEDRPKVKCPNCAEFILAEAKVCRYCGRNLSQTDVPVSKPGEGLAQGMLAAPFVGCLLIWFWIGSMSLFQGPGSSLALVGIATVLLTAGLGAADAKRLGIGAPSDARNRSGPSTWFAFIALLWIIGYPAYLGRRKLYGGRSYLVVGILVALVFAGSLAGMNSAIDAQQEKIRHILGR
jgi:RNA polymerase subunit RPABC4/transcription elongation factor Spt4